MMTSALIMVTPDLAKSYLAKSNGNRTESPVRISSYANDMKNGLWQITPQGISFNEKGVLVDGHHRLKAVIQSGATVPFYVTFDVPENATIFDRGRPRTTGQFLKFNEKITGALSQNRVVSGVRLYLTIKRKLTKPTLVSDSEILNEVQKNELLLSEATSLTSGNFTRQTPIFESFYTAMKSGYDIDKLKRFAKILSNGMYDEEGETSAVALRNLLIRTPTSHSDKVRLLMCGCVQTCLKDFSEKKKRVLIRLESGSHLIYDDYTVRL